MKIQLWNAFASNNSGSYTIVGRFESDEQATLVADELRAVLDAHQQWFEANDRADPSPLDAWCAANAFTSTGPHGREDDWPEYRSTPKVAALGTQVVMHVAYTVTMAPVFGEFFYRRNGRVDTELDHSHGPLVWFHELWWPSRNRDDAKVAAARVAVLEEALSVGGPLFEHVGPTRNPSWTERDHFMDADLTITTVWTDPAVGAAQLHAIAVRHGASMTSRVIEGHDAYDPASTQQTRRPAVSAGLVDLVLLAVGDAPQAVRRCLSTDLFHSHGEHAYAVAIVERAPTTVLHAKPRVFAEEIAKALTAAGAKVEIHDIEDGA